MKKNPSFPPHSTPWSRLWLVALLAPALLLPTTHAQRMPQDSWYLAKEFRGDIEGGKFHNPHDIAVGPDGNFYIADRSNHQIQVLDADGNFLRKWGSLGANSGEFNTPTGIHVDPDGKVYVCEWGNNRVQVFDSTGKFLRAMGQTGSAEGQLNGPHGITVDSDGNIYVAEHNNSRVSVFRPDGTYLRQWGSSGTADGQFQAIIDLCRTPDNKIAVLERDGNRRIQVFNPDGTFVLKFGSSGTADGQLNSPHGIQTDSAGNFYVSQHLNDRVTVFNSSGNYTRRFGSDGTGNGQFRDPLGMAVSNGNVIVCDYSSHRLVVFTTTGTWVKNIGNFGNREFQDTHGIAVDSQGNIFISDYQKNEIRKFDSNYNFIKRFGSTGSGDGQFSGVLELAIGPNQRLYAVDHAGHRVLYFDLEGNFLGKFGALGSGDGNFKSPWGIAIGKDNKVYVADRDNHRIQIFDENGVFLDKFGTQGSFDGQFQSPHGISVSPDGNLVVADNLNGRLQKFDSSGSFLSKVNWYFEYYRDRSWGSRIERTNISSDGTIFVSGRKQNNEYYLVVYDKNFNYVKHWYSSWAPMAETKAGDLIAAHGDRLVRVWKRTFRTVHPEPANALPLPTILSQKRRPGTALVDVDYTVKDSDNAMVQTAALAFKNGGNSLADVIPITSFADGTASKLGPNIATGQTHRFTWDVSRDWSTDFGEVQLEILAKDSRALLNLDFIQIPEVDGQPLLKISRSPLNDADFLSVWYWLIATGDNGIQFNNGIILPSQTEQVVSYDGSYGIPGLKGEYYSNTSFFGTPTTRIDYYVNIRPSTSSQSLDAPFQSEQLTVRWSGVILPTVSGNHTFFFTTDDGVRVYINNNLVINSWRTQSPTEYSANVNLTQGTSIPIRIEYYDQGGWRAAQLRWQPPGGEKNLIGPANLFTGEAAPAGQMPYMPMGQEYATGITTSATGRAYLFQKMGLREATAAEVTRAKEAGTPGVINQWDPKLRVGPDERPSKINAYGFDTGASGYWVVPVTENN
jgi:tripartite motif-containing protein 71